MNQPLKKQAVEPPMRPTPREADAKSQDQSAVQRLDELSSQVILHKTGRTTVNIHELEPCQGANQKAHEVLNQPIH